MVEQYGFFFDAGRCVHCHACEMACKSFHDVEPGVYLRKVVEIWSGKFPDVTRTFISMSCLHCAEPACEKVCPTGAISKRIEDGVVVVDRDGCTGCRDCYEACPYGVPRFGADGTMRKCDFCVETGREPACVSPCPTGALYYGTLDELDRLAAEKGTGKLPGVTSPSFYILSRNNTAFNETDLRVS
jgi:DMSO reductase iron-sulfur subunit